MSKSATLVLLGLDNAGKSTLQYGVQTLDAKECWLIHLSSLHHVDTN
jgi:chloramphenicol 3-O-phosphotransferase